MNRVLILLLFLSISMISWSQEVAGSSVSPSPAPAAAPNLTSGKSPAQLRKGILLGALDPSGTPVDDLNKDQLQILDAGQGAVPVIVRKASELPLDLGIVLYADPSTFSQQQAAAIDLVKKIIRPELDHAFVIAAGGNRPWADGNLQWQNDPAELAKTIQSLDKNTGFSDPFGYELKVTRTGMDRDAMQYFGGGNGSASVFGVIWQMMKSDARPVRKAVIIVRNAMSHSPGSTGRYSPMI